MTRWRRLLLLLAALSVAVPALAQPTPGTVTTEDQRKAQDHFQKARELYQQGNYREARSELEIARGLDPKAKDLAMNLAIVSEKMGKYDEALGWFKTFLEMEGITPGERSKAEANVKRIEGAKREAAARNAANPSASSSAAAPPSAASSSTTAPSRPERPVEASKGRVDGATIAAGVIAGVGLAGGTALGVIALTQRPSDFMTGRDGTYADLQSKTDSAHTMAIACDIALGVGVVATIATLYLYFGRTNDASAKAMWGLRF